MYVYHWTRRLVIFSSQPGRSFRLWVVIWKIVCNMSVILVRTFESPIQSLLTTFALALSSSTSYIQLAPVLFQSPASCRCRNVSRMRPWIIPARVLVCSLAHCISTAVRSHHAARCKERKVFWIRKPESIRRRNAQRRDELSISAEMYFLPWNNADICSIGVFPFHSDLLRGSTTSIGPSSNIHETWMN